MNVIFFSEHSAHNNINYAAADFHSVVLCAVNARFEDVARQQRVNRRLLCL